MAVTIIIIGTLSIIATVMAVLALMPVIQEMGTDQEGNWDEQNELRTKDCNTAFTTPEDIAVCEERKLNAERAIISRDRAFSAILVLPIFLIGAIAAWSFLAVTRRDFGEV